MSFDEFAEAERTRWDRRVAVYADTTARATTQAIPVLLAAARVAAGRRVLDVCCGPGYAAGAAAALGAEAQGVDAAPAMAAAARATFPACRFEVADATALPAADGAFDAAVCSFGLFHLADPAAALAEMHRVLAPGGRIAASQWAGPPVSPFFRVVFGALGAHADMAAAPPGPMKRLIADRGYDANALRRTLREAGAIPVIPGPRNRKKPVRHDQRRYRDRWRVEAAFCRLKDFRRIATRYDKLAANFLSAVCIAAVVAFWS